MEPDGILVSLQQPSPFSRNRLRASAVRQALEIPLLHRKGLELRIETLDPHSVHILDVVRNLMDQHGLDRSPRALLDEYEPVARIVHAARAEPPLLGG